MEKFSNITISTDISTMLPWYLLMSITATVIILSTISLVLILAVEKFRDQKEYILFAANLIHELLYGMSELLSSSTKVAVYLGYHCKFIIDYSHNRYVL